MCDILSSEEIDMLKKIILYKDTEIRQSIGTLTTEQIKADFLKIHEELINALKDFSIEYTNLADKLESFFQKSENIAVQGTDLVNDFFNAIQDFSKVISDITTLIFVILGECDLESEISKMEMANAELLIKANVVTERLESYKKWADNDFVASEDVIMMQIQSLNMFINDIKGELNIISSANMQWRDTGLEKRYNNVISESNKAIAIIKNAIIEFVDTIKSKSNVNTSKNLNKLDDLITKANGLEILKEYLAELGSEKWVIY